MRRNANAGTDRRRSLPGAYPYAVAPKSAAFILFGIGKLTPVFHKINDLNRHFLIIYA